MEEVFTWLNELRIWPFLILHRYLSKVPAKIILYKSSSEQFLSSSFTHYRNTWNLSIYNIKRWFAGPMGQMTCQPSISCSKYFFFHKILQSSFNHFFYKITKIKIKINSFECYKSIMKYEKKYLKHQMHGPRVICPIGPANQHIILQIVRFWAMLLHTMEKINQLVP